MILIRFVLISLIVYLIIRSFIRYSEKDKSAVHGSEKDQNNTVRGKKVSRKIGEYIDYEEVKK